MRRTEETQLSGSPASTGFHDPNIKGAIKRILELQQPNGAIPWFENGPWDAWNHTECVIALSAAGYFKQAAHALDHLQHLQKPDGSIPGEYGNAVPMQDHTHMARTHTPLFHDTNFTAYCAVGVWRYVLDTKNLSHAKRWWPMVMQAMSFVTSLQSEHGDILWASEGLIGGPDDALVAGNASIHKSLECAIAFAEALDETQHADYWRMARQNIGECLRQNPARFDRAGHSRANFAMDWYYPILAGVLDKPSALARLNTHWDTFIEPKLGCRCVKEEPWVTTAETCELILALISVGERARAKTLFETVQSHANSDGAYWMGWQFEEQIFWPEETPSWTQAAVIIAADALYNTSAASQLLVRHMST